MTTYAWPTTRHFVPATHELRVVDNTQRTVESSLSGYVQTNAMPGARWGWGMDFTPHTQAQRAELEAYLLRLSGRQHRVRLWDMRNPRPRGNIALAGVTLGAAAAQFAATLVLAGCQPASNLVKNSSFEVDSNADGLADEWSVAQSGSVSGRAVYSSTTAAVHGLRTQQIDTSSLGATESDYVLVRQFVPASASPARPYSAAVSFLASVGCKVSIRIQYRLAGAFVSEVFTQVTATGASQRISVTGAPTGAADEIELQIRQAAMPGAVGTSIFIDAVQLNAGDALDGYTARATLLAGDWLGLTGGQLVRVVADAEATDAGAMTVEVRHMLRSAVASGSAVVLDKPTALYVRTEAGLAMPRQPGHVDPAMSVEFVEVFA